MRTENQSGGGPILKMTMPYELLLPMVIKIELMALCLEEVAVGRRPQVCMWYDGICQEIAAFVLVSII